MHLSEYQSLARGTDQVPTEVDADGIPTGSGVLVPLLGLAGEVGSLLSEYKKHLRDGKAHRLFREQIGEDLGDLLWYVATVASKFGLDLGEIAAQNLVKTQERWPSAGAHPGDLFDEDYPLEERLPRQFEVELEQVLDGTRAEVRCLMNGKQIGNTVTDNAHEDDGYRFHDVFHFSYATILGWSPITRSLMQRQRRSNSNTDVVEDGGRAKVIEELISALVFDYARKHDYLADVRALDHHLLKTIKGLVADREVKVRPLYDWEQTILASYRVWRQVREHGGGIVVGDLATRKLDFRARR